MCVFKISDVENCFFLLGCNAAFIYYSVLDLAYIITYEINMILIHTFHVKVDLKYLARFFTLIENNML